MAPVNRVAVIGAGLSGLATSAFLAQIKLNVDLFEQQSAAGDQGVIVLDDVAQRLINMLSLYESLHSHYSIIKRVTLVRHDGNRADAREINAVAIRRSTLLSAFESKLAKPVSRNRGVAAVQDGSDSATIVFQDGSKASYDLVIVADGPMSTIRAKLAANQQRSVSQAEHPVIVHKFDLPSVPGQTEEILEALGTGQGLYIVPLRDRCVGVSFASGAPGVSPPMRSAPNSVGALQELLSPLGSLTSLLSGASNISAKQIFPQLVMNPWEGRVVLLGDAAHVIVPTVIPSALLGLEDSKAVQFVLDRCSTLAEAKAMFDRFRAERVRSVSGLSWSVAFQNEKPNDYKTLFREALRSLASFFGANPNAGMDAVETLLAHNPASAAPSGSSRALLRFLIKVGQVDGNFDAAEREFVRASMFELGTYVSPEEMLQIERETPNQRVLEIVKPFVELDRSTRERVLKLGVYLAAASGRVASDERKALSETARALGLEHEVYQQLIDQAIKDQP